MAGMSDEDALCCEFFRLCVESEERGQQVCDATKKQGDINTVRKILTDLGENGMTISHCQKNLLPKYVDKQTQKISDEHFIQKILPEVASSKVKVKNVTDPKAQEELSKMKKRLCTKLEEKKKLKETDKTAAPRSVITSKLNPQSDGKLKDSGKDLKSRIKIRPAEDELRPFIGHQSMHAPH